MIGLGLSRQGSRRGSGAGKKDQRQKQDQGSRYFQKGVQHLHNLSAPWSPVNLPGHPEDRLSPKTGSQSPQVVDE
jgi:hypothetical protein